MTENSKLPQRREKEAEGTSVAALRESAGSAIREQAAFPASTSLPSLLVATSSHHGSPFPVSRPTQPPQAISTGGGMRLEAVMENLQRQQAARLALEEKLRQEKDRELRCLVESRIQQQALAIRHYQAAVRAAAAAVVTTPSISNTTNTTTTTTTASGSSLPQNRTALIFPRTPIQKSEDEDSKHKSDGDEADYEDEDMDDEEGEEEMEHMEMNSNAPPGSPSKGLSRVNQSQLPNTSSQSQSLSPNGQSGHHEWTYEEQFKQVRHLTKPSIMLSLVEHQKHAKFCLKYHQATFNYEILGRIFNFFSSIAGWRRYLNPKGVRDDNGVLAVSSRECPVLGYILCSTTREHSKSFFFLGSLSRSDEGLPTLSE
ncbi:AT-rich interactive domain-containing protein 3C [Mantella aurantiaca]